MIRACLEDSPSQTDRRYTFSRVNHYCADAVLVVRVGAKKRDVYAVQEEGQEAPGRSRVFLLLKLNKPHSEFGPYEVRVSAVAGEYASCSCIGFGRWNACKHADALYDLVANHKLPRL